MGYEVNVISFTTVCITTGPRGVVQRWGRDVRSTANDLGSLSAHLHCHLRGLRDVDEKPSPSTVPVYTHKLA